MCIIHAIVYTFGFAGRAISSSLLSVLSVSDSVSSSLLSSSLSSDSLYTHAHTRAHTHTHTHTHPHTHTRGKGEERIRLYFPPPTIYRYTPLQCTRTSFSVFFPNLFFNFSRASSSSLEVSSPSSSLSVSLPLSVPDSDSDSRPLPSSEPGGNGLSHI